MNDYLHMARMNRAKLVNDIVELDWFIAFSEDLLRAAREGHALQDGDFAMPDARAPDQRRSTDPNVVWLERAAAGD